MSYKVKSCRLLLYHRVLLVEAAISLDKASFTWLPMVQIKEKGKARRTVICFSGCYCLSLLANALLNTAVH